MANIQVLLSTYNGEKFLLQQLDSIVKQKNHKISLLVRDDGSTDSTMMILQNYQMNNPSLIMDVYAGKNVGVYQSFMDLVAKSSSTCDFYAFSDQDDVWLPQKMNRAVEHIGHTKHAEMYCSSYIPTDEDLKPLSIGRMFDLVPSFQNSIVENIAIGCSIVYTKSFRSRLLESIDAKVSIHDWWCYQIATAFGVMVYDNYPTLLYRQHASNAIGAKKSELEKWISRAKRYSRWTKDVRNHAVELLRIYGKDLPPGSKKILNEFLDYNDTNIFNVILAVRLLINRGIVRQTRIDNFLIKLLILTHAFRN